MLNYFLTQSTKGPKSSIHVEYAKPDFWVYNYCDKLQHQKRMFAFRPLKKGVGLLAKWNRPKAKRMTTCNSARYNV